VLPRAQRLRTDRDIRTALRVGDRRNGPNLGLRIRPHPELPARFAFVISKQVSKRAVVRNQLRRRLREIVRALTPPAADVVVIARPSAIRQTVPQLRTELIQLLTPRSRAPHPRLRH